MTKDISCNLIIDINAMKNIKHMKKLKMNKSQLKQFQEALKTLELECLQWKESTNNRYLFVKEYQIKQRKGKYGFIEKYDVFENNELKHTGSNYYHLYAFATFNTKRHLEDFLGERLPE